jgi:DtxR family transcriptional regulator, Mn-dependent transcriptional regulator
MAEQLDAALGSPHADPHGQPIPRPGAAITALKGRRLSDLRVGEQGRVVALQERSAEGLRRLADLGLTPSAAVQVIGRTNGVLRVRTADADREVDARLATAVLIATE